MTAQGPNPPHPQGPPAGGPPPRQDDLLRKPAGGPAPTGPGPDGPPAGRPPQAGSGPHPSADRPGGESFQQPAGFDDRGRVRRGKVSAAWVGLIAAAVVLILLIIFIAQNLNRASIHFLGLNGHMPLGLMLLIAAVAGVLLVAVPGSIRIFQLRRALKHNTPPDQRTPTGEHPRR